MFKTELSFPSNVLFFLLPVSENIAPPQGSKLEVRIWSSYLPLTYVSHSIRHQVLSFLPLKSIHFFPSQDCHCSSCHYLPPHVSPCLQVPMGSLSPPTTAENPSTALRKKTSLSNFKTPTFWPPFTSNFISLFPASHLIVPANSLSCFSLACLCLLFPFLLISFPSSLSTNSYSYFQT